MNFYLSVEVYIPTHPRADDWVCLGEGGLVAAFQFFFLQSLQEGLVMLADLARQVTEFEVIDAFDDACCFSLLGHCCPCCYNQVIFFHAVLRGRCYCRGSTHLWGSWRSRMTGGTQWNVKFLYETSCDSACRASHLIPCKNFLVLHPSW